MQRFRIFFAKSNTGREYVTDMMHKLDLSTMNRALHLINLLSQYGYQIGNKYLKKVRNELYELRVLGRVQIRVLLAFNGETIVLLHAFKKKSNRIPIKEIATATNRLTSYKIKY